MSLVQVVDSIVPEVFTQYMTNDTMVKSDIFDSGLVVPDPMMTQLLSGGGRLFQHPVWGDLDDTPAVNVSDDPNQDITPAKLGSFKHQFIRQSKAHARSAADLVADLAGSDPMARIIDRIGPYWQRQFNRFTIQTINGVLNDNVANDGGDMVLDITARTGTVAVSPVLSVNAYNLHAGAALEAKQKLGDAAEQLTIMLMHSRVYTNLQLQNLIVYIPNARGEVKIPTYLGYRVVVTDTCPVTAVATDFHYTTYLAAPGIIGYGEKTVKKPIAVERKELAGNGGGIETLVTRRQFALHPYGFNFTDANTAGEFPTEAEMILAANWDRVYPERKQIKLVAIVSKNG